MLSFLVVSNFISDHNFLHQIIVNAVYTDMSKFEGVYQYGSDWVMEKACRQDGVAVQARIRNLDPDFNEYIPMDDEHKGIRNFLDAHYVKNYGRMLDELNEEKGDQTFIRKR